MSSFFARNLKYLRERSGLEQLELALKIGRKSASSVSEWEKGLYVPKVGVLSKIAAVFHVTLQDLMDTDLTNPQDLVLIYDTDEERELAEAVKNDPELRATIKYMMKMSPESKKDLTSMMKRVYELEKK